MPQNKFTRRSPEPGRATKYNGLIKIGGQWLPPREALFLREYIKDWNGAQASLRASLTIDRNCAGWFASDMLKRPRVLLALHTLLKERQQRMDIGADEVVRYWHTLAHADATELNPARRRCCRYCWGIDNQYQLTLSEHRQLVQEHRRKFAKDRNPPLLDEKGGPGFLPTKEPNSGCPECGGSGIWRLEPIDLENLSPGARMLFDGLKVYRDGSVEVRTRNRDTAMRNLSELLGFIRPRRGLWDFDFDSLDDTQLDALINEARSRGLLTDAEMPMRDVTPSRESLPSPETVDDDERVS